MAHWVRFFLGMLTGIGLVKSFANSQKRRSKRLSDLAATVAVFSKMTMEDLKKIFPAQNYPSWVAFTELQKLNWLNRELTKLWPYIDKATSELIKSSVEPLLEQHKPSLLSSLKFSELTLGDIVPQFTGVCIVEDDKDAIIMEFEFIWNGNPSIILDVETAVGISFPIQVKDIGFVGDFRLIFKPLVDQLPCIAAVCFSLAKKKRLNFTLKAIGREISSVPGVSSALEEAIHDALEESITWPARKVIPIIPGDYSYLEMRPVGSLEVKLIQATDLKNTDMARMTDPFVRLYVRPLPILARTSKTIENDLNPIWNEQFEFDVEDISTQHLTIKLYDSDIIRSDLIGCAQVPLKDLQPGKIKSIWLELVEGVHARRDNEYRGQVHLEIVYYPFDVNHELLNPFSNVESSMHSLNNVSEDENIFVSSNGKRSSYKKWDISGSLSVTVLYAENLPASDLTGKADPFVKLLLKESEAIRETSVVNGHLNPSWNQTFVFVVEKGWYDLLLLEIWDQDIYKKDYIGRCVMTLTQVMTEGEIEGSYPLEGTASGKLTLRLKWVPKFSAQLDA